MHVKQIVKAGTPLNKAEKALILLHGRGASAEDILTLADHFSLHNFALLAPQATNHSWYPYSFLQPPVKNEPWLSSALSLLSEMVADIEVSGISADQVYFLGFSQGACLTLEFTARNARKYGGIIAFTGGLIGDKVYTGNYKGDFDGTPVFLGSSDPDMHVPVERVHESSAILRSMNADLVEKIYKGIGHTIIGEEIQIAGEHVFRSPE